MKEISRGVFQSQKLYEGATINLTIPVNYTAMFSSATSDKGNTVSGMFDIQYRRWKLDRWEIFEKGQPFVIGDSNHTGSLVSQDDILLREGLIIDMRHNPGIGFRNHTIPIGLPHGGTWSEDITWIEPVSQCADTNLSIELITDNEAKSFSGGKAFSIIDRGAFIGLNYTEIESRPWNDNQTLDLFGRAHKAARMHNVLMASSLNISLPLDSQTRTVPKIPTSDDKYFMNSDTITRGKIGLLASTVPGVPGYTNLSNFIPYYPDRITKLLALNYSAVGMLSYRSG